MRSIYSRIFSYRQNEKLSPTENFLTEILGYCLQTDKNFFLEFLKIIDFENLDEDIFIRTQSSYSDLGRPDIEITSNNFQIIIECKVESTERWNQLLDYNTILKNSGKKHKKLVYLTKYIESKESETLGETFKEICWYDLAKKITNKNSPFTIELKKYLTEMNMSNIRFFFRHGFGGIKNTFSYNRKNG